VRKARRSGPAPRGAAKRKAAAASNIA
jgi:hypothetical protein